MVVDTACPFLCRSIARYRDRERYNNAPEIAMISMTAPKPPIIAPKWFDESNGEEERGEEDGEPPVGIDEGVWSWLLVEVEMGEPTFSTET